MITIKEYVVANDLDHAYELLRSKKNNIILGGCGFIKLGSKNINTAIDLKNIGLDYIKENDEEILIGADVSLRDLETSSLIINYCNGFISDAISNIVGVQFRNNARVGASVFSKYGFSDLIPTLLVANAKVKLHNRGVLSLEEFLNNDLEKDILVEIILPKVKGYGVFDSIRKCTGDFSIINGAILKVNDEYKISIGARPQRAVIAYKGSDILTKEKDINKAVEMVSEELIFGSNMRASKEYRADMAKSLVYRMYENLGGECGDK